MEAPADSKNVETIVIRLIFTHPSIHRMTINFEQTLFNKPDCNGKPQFFIELGMKNRTGLAKPQPIRFQRERKYPFGFGR